MDRSESWVRLYCEDIRALLPDLPACCPSCHDELEGGLGCHSEAYLSYGGMEVQVFTCCTVAAALTHERIEAILPDILGPVDEVGGDLLCSRED